MTEEEQILASFDNLMDACHKLKHLSSKEEDNILRAFNLANKAHAGTRRKSGEPYIFHPLSVALIAVREVGLGPIAVISALLHDVVEDTDVTLDQIRLLFGDRVALIVDGVTKIDTATEHLQVYGNAGRFNEDNVSKQAENYRKILLAMCDDVYVIFLKLCDRLHNMRTLGSMKDTKKLAISSETQYLYIPLAHRLGLYNIKTELEELVMKYTNPARYEEISAQIASSAGTELKLKTCFTAPIRKILDENGYKYDLKTRVKSVYSCWKKMEKKGVEFDEIFDLYAMRIIIDTDNKQECFKVYSLITQLFSPNPTRFRDWITAPKTNGYESLHTTVMTPLGRWVEVQIRTKAMDEVAEKGMAAHFLYKEAHPETINNNSVVEDWLRQIRTTLETSDKSALDLVEEFKETLYIKEIYLFTPKGENIKLPAGSTVLDFAFAIHTDLGLTCMGAKVNSKVVPMGFVLHSGEQVQILTSRKSKPDESWLSMARTTHAKEKIKENLRQQKRKYRNSGEANMKALLNKLGITHDTAAINRIRHYFNVDDDVELYYRVAVGEINEETLSLCFNIVHKTPQILFPQPAVNPFFIDKDYEQLESYPAPCCKPIQGDDVVGILDDGKIAVHRANCPIAMHEMSTHENKTVRARWRRGEKVSFLTGVTLNAIDQKGILQEMVRIITEEMDLNMRAITFEASEGVAHGSVMLYVDNLNKLNELIKKLQSIDGVENVKRI